MKRAIRLSGGCLVGLLAQSTLASDFAVDRAVDPKPPLVQQVQAKELPPAKEVPPAKEPPKLQMPIAREGINTAYASTESLAIDLPTALRLVNDKSPIIGIARSRVEQALARQDLADLLKLPNLSVGGTYYRLDGNTQNQAGSVFSVSRSNLFGGFGPTLRLDLADAIFEPLITRRQSASLAAEARSVEYQVQLQAVSAYLELQQIYASLAINQDTLERAGAMLKAAKAADETGLSKTKADLNRAQTEVNQRIQEQNEIRGRIGVASAKLARLLLLTPDIELKPVEPAVVPLILVPTDMRMDELILTAIQNRPDLEANREALLAAQERVRQARLGPLIPKTSLDYQFGAFGGGTNSNLSDFRDRGVIGAQIYWEFRNLGLGNRAITRERQAFADQVQFQLFDLQAKVGAEVSASARRSAALLESMKYAEKAVFEAKETYRKLQETSFNLVGPNARYDALEPLLAIQALNSTQVQYLKAVIDFNLSQFELYVALGQPSDTALATAKEVPTESPVVPLKK